MTTPDRSRGTESRVLKVCKNPQGEDRGERALRQVQGRCVAGGREEGSREEERVVEGVGGERNMDNTN